MAPWTKERMRRAPGFLFSPRAYAQRALRLGSVIFFFLVFCAYRDARGNGGDGSGDLPRRDRPLFWLRGTHRKFLWPSKQKKINKITHPKRSCAVCSSCLSPLQSVPWLQCGRGPTAAVDANKGATRVFLRSQDARLYGFCGYKAGTTTRRGSYGRYGGRGRLSTESGASSRSTPVRWALM